MARNQSQVDNFNAIDLMAAVIIIASTLAGYIVVGTINNNYYAANAGALAGFLVGIVLVSMALIARTK